MRALLALALCAGCGIVDEAIATRIIEDQERIRTSEALVVERGVVPGQPEVELRSRVRFRAPSHVHVEVLSPEEWRGDTLAYVGSELWLYSARRKAGVHMTGLPWRRSTWVGALRETVRWNRENFDHVEGPTRDTIGGRVASSWTVTPRTDGDLRFASRWWTDAEFHVPLRVEAGEYRMTVEDASFNRPVAAPAFEPPEGSHYLEWDLEDPGVPLEEAPVDFPILQGEGLALKKVVPARVSYFPMVALVYEGGPFYAIVIQGRDRGMVDPHGFAVDLGDGEGRLGTIGATSFLSFTRNEVEVLIGSNLPAPELVRFARTLR